MDEKTAAIVKELADASANIAGLTGNDLAAALLRLVGVASQGYQLVTGLPVDPALVPKIERLA